MKIREWKSHPDFPIGNDCQLRGFWEFELTPGEATISHQHDDSHEVDIIIAGTGLVTVGELTREVKTGDVIYVPSRTPHAIRNHSNAPLRGVTIDNTAIELYGGESPENVTVRDLEDLIQDIPTDLDVSGSLQMIIRLFDMAGYVSEQIDESVGLENEAGFEALKQIERKVMDAVVEISSLYQMGGQPESQHPRF